MTIMAIRVLPDYIINRLKAGEIVERPASVLKELMENALDSGATRIDVALEHGGSSLIRVTDNGDGIDADDLPLVLARYATSKIGDVDDLQSIATYGFRGEALASIAEVSKVSIHTKTLGQDIGNELVKHPDEVIVKPKAFASNSGTSVSVEDLFYNVPARQKFLKTPQTEYRYCYQLFLDFALVHRDIHWTLTHNDKRIWSLAPQDDLISSLELLYKKNWSANVHRIAFESEDLKISGVVGDATLRFSTTDNMRFFVNKRPVEDKIIKKALVDAYERQFAPREYPLAMIFVEIHPRLVDVNVHPRKKEVRFIDPQRMYQTSKNVIQESLSKSKIMQTSHTTPSFAAISSSFVPQAKTTAPKQFGHASNKKRAQSSYTFRGETPTPRPEPSPSEGPSLFVGTKSDTRYVHSTASLDSETEKTLQVDDITLTITGQVWNSYIVATTDDALYYIDQHALAERISFEKMKRELKEQTNAAASDSLLHPLSIDIPANILIEQKIEDLTGLGFTCDLISAQKLVVYAIPKVFVTHQINLEKVFEKILYLEELSLDVILDTIFASKACKTSIKAGHKLTLVQMENLVRDGFLHIEGMFVCQHGRPFFIEVKKTAIDSLFDR